MRDWRLVVRERLAGARITPSAEPDVVEEVAQHLEDQQRELMARGMTESDAQGVLLAQLSDDALGQIATRWRRMPRTADVDPRASRVSRWLSDVRDDLRYGLRALRKAPGFTVVAIATLGLGIAGTTVMYSVVDAVLVRSLPFAEPQSIVRLFHSIPADLGGRQNLSVADFFAARSSSRSFTTMATYSVFDNGVTYVGGDRPERVYGAAVSGEFFKTLGVAPVRGRAFSIADEAPEAPSLAIIGYDFWRRRLGGAENVIGRAINLQGRAVTVVGVMPPGFWFPRGDRAEFWTNNRPQPPRCECGFSKRVIARLKPGVSPQQMQSELDAVATSVRASFPGGPSTWTLMGQPLRDSLVSDVKPVLALLMGAVALVLLIACVNVTNLVLTRATSRETELSVRVALGASGLRLARQLIVETAVLAIAGASVGVALAWWGLGSLLQFIPESAPILRDAGVVVNLRVLIAAAAFALACMFGVGLLPAWIAAHSDAGNAMRDGGRGGGSRQRRRVRDALVVAEFAISVMLVVGAGLMIRSLAKLRHVDLGVHTDGLLTASISLPNVRYGSMESIVGFADRLQERLREVPAVSHAAVTVGLPPDRLTDATNFKPEGMSLPPGEWEPIADHLWVTDDYFATMGIPLVAGRIFDGRDRDTNGVAVISNALAKQIFRGRNPIGQRMLVSGDTRVTIIGVVGDVKYSGPAESARITLYQSFNQFPQWTFSVVARVNDDPTMIVTPLRRIVASIDPEIAVAEVLTLRDLVDASASAARFRALVLAIFAGTALLLAAIGIYGVMSFAVAARTREIGVRVALGARARDVTTMLLRDGLARAALGVGLGLVGAAGITRLMTKLLFGVAATDPMTFGTVSIVLLVVAAGACWLPARRAARVDPIIALRADSGG